MALSPFNNDTAGHALPSFSCTALPTNLPTTATPPPPLTQSLPHPPHPPNDASENSTRKEGVVEGFIETPEITLGARTLPSPPSQVNSQLDVESRGVVVLTLHSGTKPVGKSGA